MLAYVKLFAEVTLSYLQRCGISLKGSHVRTDNDNEFVGNWQRKADIAFALVEAVKGFRHMTILLRAHT